MEKSKVVSSRLFKASRNGSETLDVMEEHLDVIALRIPTTVESWLPFAHGMRVDYSSHAERLDLVTDCVRIVSGVRYQRFSARMRGDDRFGGGRFVSVPGCELDVDRASFRVDEGVDFRGEATSRVTQCIAEDPPFPPAASWCARTTEASMMTPSSSVSSCNALKIAAQCPRWDQLENRLNTVFHEPNRSGRSRQGTPVFARYNTASMKVRSSSVGRGPRRDGTTRLTMAHCGSVSAWRRVTASFDHSPTRFCKHFVVAIA